jgi:hypothetical protein
VEVEVDEIVATVLFGVVVTEFTTDKEARIWFVCPYHSPELTTTIAKNV